MSRRFGTTRTRGLGSARVCSIAPGAVLVVALAGCSSGQSTLDEPAVNQAHEADASPASPADQPSGPPAFHFASGDLVLGDFTYEDVAGNIFNPCEEISAEEFAAIGFEIVGQPSRREFGDVYGCAIRSESSPVGLVEVLMGGSANIEDAREQVGVESRHRSEYVPGLYVYGPTTGDSDACFAAVDTERGQFSVATGGSGSESSEFNLCDRAIEILEKLYAL